MVKMFNELGDTASFYSETVKAMISGIPKEGKDPKQWGSYRLISLLNADLKIFNKIIAMRLQQQLPSLIHQDQVGFVTTREARDNTIKALNCMHIAKSIGTSCVFLGTDAEKAFDRVGWGFMFAVLRHIKLGGKMIRWIASMYKGPTAQVKVNGVVSPFFAIMNGTKQGCPLSPLLFALTLEPFLWRIRLNRDIWGVGIGGIQYKVAAYADDMLFSMTNPVISLPNLFKEIELYSTLSYFKINLSKSEALMVAVPKEMMKSIKLKLQI